MRNILIDRHNESDVLWAGRHLKPAKAHSTQYTSKTLKQLRHEVHRFIVSHGINEVNFNESGNNLKENEVSDTKIKAIIEEICCSYNESLVRCLGVICSKLLKRYYSGVFVDEESLIKIKSIMGNSPVILVPSHRSYCDFIIMAFIFFTFDIEIPCVAAAIDFSSMKIIGNMLRECKAFFIRRNFNKDPLYKYIFQRYLQYLIIYGNSPVEFFIEGTRSRTGKSLPPKFGLLKTIVDTFIDNDVPEVVLVPVSVSYDKVLEDTLFSYELLGIPKPPESTKGFFKALATMEKQYGNIFVNFGEPIYLKHYLTEYDLSSWSNDSGDILEKLGFHVIKEQQNLQKILCIHMLCLIFYDHLMKNGYVPLESTTVCSRLASLKEIFQLLGSSVYLPKDISHCLDQVLSIHKNLFTVEYRSIRLNRCQGISQTFGEIQFKGAKLSGGILEDAVTILMLQQYTNPLLSVLATPALLIFISQNYYIIGEIFSKYKLFSRLFYNEFIFTKEDEVKTFWKSLNKLVESGIIESNSGNIKIIKTNWMSHSISSILYPYFFSYQCSCRVLKNSLEEVSINDLVKSTQLLIENEIKVQGNFHHAALSIDTITQSINTLVNLKVIAKTTRDGRDVYSVINNSFLKELLNEIEILVRAYELFWNENDLYLPMTSKL